MKRLENKVAIITGPPTGIGVLAARLFAKKGVEGLITEVQEGKFKAIVVEIKTDGGIAQYIVHEVTSGESGKKVAQKEETVFSKIDVFW